VEVFEMKTSVAALVVSACVLAAPVLSQSGSVPNYPTQPIELKYFDDGPWEVSVTQVADCVSKVIVANTLVLPLQCEIYHPTELGSDPGVPVSSGFKHPIVVWGNGTGAMLPGAYSYWLAHLASWGFVVIRTSDPTAGNGQTLLDSMDYLIARNGDPASVYYDKLDTDHIGAAGHSQGAAGAINAMNTSNGQIRAALAIHLPFNFACVLPCVDEQKLIGATAGSIFYVSGTLDPISPDTQLLPGPLNSNMAFYSATPAALTKVKAILKGGAHDDVTGKPTCTLLCSNGVYGYLGYPTAWLMWRLRDAADGRDAFKSPDGEIFQETQNWQGVASNVN
jgi:hypothetical protein